MSRRLHRPRAERGLAALFKNILMTIGSGGSNMQLGASRVRPAIAGAVIIILAAAVSAQETGFSEVFESPRDLTACQIGYGAEGRVRLTWSNPERFDAVAAFIDAEHVPVHIDGAWGRVVVGAAPGPHELAVQGFVGDWTSERATVDFEVLETSPIPEPVAGVTCEYIPSSAGRLLIDWTDGPDADKWTFGEVRIGGSENPVDIVTFSKDDPRPIQVDLEGRPLGLVEIAFADALCYFSDPIELECVQLQPTFRRGDCNRNGIVNITDPIFLVNHLFKTGRRWLCDDACDSDDNGVIDLSDAMVILEYLFRSAAPPAAPGPDACGVDPTPDALGGFCADICP
ncbi:MAG: hypothetical protein JXA90_01515 [Planctomycetes bacterium]|nr:hypothetical protein [Planctomycetota bacterium]